MVVGGLYSVLWGRSKEYNQLMLKSELPSEKAKILKETDQFRLITLFSIHTHACMLNIGFPCYVEYWFYWTSDWRYDCFSFLIIHSKIPVPVLHAHPTSYFSKYYSLLSSSFSDPLKSFYKLMVLQQYYCGTRFSGILPCWFIFWKTWEWISW